MAFSFSRFALSMLSLLLAAGLLASGRAAHAADAGQTISFPAGAGAGAGRKIVLVSGDQEYRSEEGLPQLAKILAKYHGFNTTVVFALDPDGTINVDNENNIPGLEALDTADLMIIATRHRNLPDDQMKHIADYVEAGKPVISLRTATHAFLIPADRKYAHYGNEHKGGDWDGGFGRRVLGEHWINHHGKHGSESTRGIFAPGQADNPILRGIKDGEIWGPTDVYAVRLPLPEGCTPLVLGQVLEGMSPNDKPLAGPKNDPMMPVAWTRVRTENGKPARSFTTTMGSSKDLENEALRRLVVNASYWAVGSEDKIPAKAVVDIVGKYETLPFKFGGSKKGVKPGDLTN
ncbi:MAG TPA: ThuA domain-containing protein [Pirellulales bacterium]|nr:ThuA domain-containing protein [Pirellulales bacterium]